MTASEEKKRLGDSSFDEVPPWQKWGPYVAERAWGTVREDYSPNGDAWNYFPFGKAHQKVYRWGEDGIAGWCDRYQVLVLAPAFWNGRDPILKERHFGLNPWEGNHGEDVKECYFHLDGTPTHSYMKYLYKYPQNEFPYRQLLEENRRRGIQEPEFELLDTGIFEEDRYFDIFIEYAKASPEDVCMRIQAFNRGPQAAELHLLPQLWFRNQWSWGEKLLPEPEITASGHASALCLVADDGRLKSPANLMFDYHLGKRYFYGPEGAKMLFTDNENPHSGRPYVKDGFHRAVIEGASSVNPDQKGTKACFHYSFQIPAQGAVTLCFRLTPQPLQDPLGDVDEIIDSRKSEADSFYAEIHPQNATDEERRIQRQAFAGMLWNKQVYLYDVNRWLEGDNPSSPPPAERLSQRNSHWRHLNSMRVLSMPDKWEFPWFASWDLAFHAVSWGLIDLEFAKEQLWLLLFDQFQHPNGAIPAYEWEFSDLNPPVQAWAALKLYKMEIEQKGEGDDRFLGRCFLKLLLNFIWWVNKVDTAGFNVFEGGFLGLDNITLVDRSVELESGAVLRQSDGTAWMAMFCLNLMRMAMELAKRKWKGYETLASKFFQHFAYIAHAMKIRDNHRYEMWSEKDGFFYDVLSYPDGSFSKFRVRSLVGIIPLFAVDRIQESELDELPVFKKNFLWFLANRQTLVAESVFKKDSEYLLSLVNEKQLASVIGYLRNPKEFLSPFGLRSLSKFHEHTPFRYRDWKISYEPGVSLSYLKGGNSNWRGPIWMPMNYLLIQSLNQYQGFYSEALDEIANDFVHRILNLFLPDEKGTRPFRGLNYPHNDPLWNPYLQFFEYFHAETGQGLGASHQTGWTALICNLIHEKYHPRSKL